MLSRELGARLWTLTFAVFLAFGDVSIVAAQSGTAAILVGDVNGNPLTRGAMDAAAARYALNAVRAGYTLANIGSATADQMAAAITAEPEVLVICAHATGGSGAGVEATSGALTPASFPDGSTFPGVKEVVFASCSQLDPARLAEWKVLFPQANIHGYQGCVNPWKVALDALSYVFHPPTVPPAAGAAPFSVAPLPQPTPATVVVNGNTIINYPTPLNPAFHTPPDVATAVGQQTINLCATETASGEEVFILGMVVDNGVVTEFRNDIAYDQPSVTIRMMDSVFQQVSAVPAELHSEYLKGHVDIERVGTNVPEELLVNGTSILAFGAGFEVPAVSEWGVLVMALITLVAGTILIGRARLARV